MSAYAVLAFAIFAVTPALTDAGETLERAPIHFEDAQAVFLQNRNSFRSLRVRWRLTLECTAAAWAYRKHSGTPPIPEPQTSTFEFWTDGTKWELLWFCDANTRLRITSAEAADFPPITPVRGTALMELQPHLHLIDRVMLRDWPTTLHICDGCTVNSSRHYFALFGEEVPHQQYLTPQEREEYRLHTQLFEGWLVEVDFVRGGLPVRMWKWSRMYIDEAELSQEEPMSHIRHGVPDLEITHIQQVVAGSFYPMRVTQRTFVLKPELARKVLSFEERLRRYSQCPLSRAAVSKREHWNVQAITANVPSETSEGPPIGQAAVSTSRAANLPAGPFSTTPRAAGATGRPPALPFLFLVACVLAILGFLVRYAILKSR